MYYSLYSGHWRPTALNEVPKQFLNNYSPAKSSIRNFGTLFAKMAEIEEL
jgi:hypothetical protein